jgi:hypothetical protein
MKRAEALRVEAANPIPIFRAGRRYPTGKQLLFPAFLPAANVAASMAATVSTRVERALRKTVAARRRIREALDFFSTVVEPFAHDRGLPLCIRKLFVAVKHRGTAFATT